jgi:hypothetical protein
MLLVAASEAMDPRRAKLRMFVCLRTSRAMSGQAGSPEAVSSQLEHRGRLIEHPNDLIIMLYFRYA